MNGPTATRPKFPSLGKAASWRGAVLLALYIVPPVVYFCLGAWWLFEKGLLIYGLAGWLICTILFSIFSKRWFEGAEKILPPLNWEKPWTFAPRDAQAWAIVQETALQANELTLEHLSRIETYRETSDELARRIAACYYPNVENPLEKVPIVDLIVAIQLASEDLERLCRQIPVMDQLTPGHLKGITKAMGMAQSANEIYNFALPVFRPVTGLPRLLVQKLVAEPAWRQTKEGVQRWLFRAYVNRLGVHLVELCSGRLRAGSAAYRRSSSRSMPPHDNKDADRETAVTAESRSVTKAIVLSPGSVEKSSRERIGQWRHLASTAENEIAATLNVRFLSLEGVDALPDIVWNAKAWPHDPSEFIPSGSGDSWEGSLGELTQADMIVVDLRNVAGDEALTKAQTLLDRLGSEYDRLSDWPVAPIVLIADPADLAGLVVHPHLIRETRISDASLQADPDRSADIGPAESRNPEIETLATIATVLPLAHQRQFARQMTSESRKSGFRRAAGQVADAAGKAGMDFVRGWLNRKSTPSHTSQNPRTHDDDEATRSSKA